MRVLNVNEKIRKQVAKLYEDSGFFVNHDYDELLNKLQSLYDFIKENNELSRYVLGVLFTTSYIYNYDSSLRYLDEENEEKIMLYETFFNVKEIRDVISKNDFLNLCDDVFAFEELSCFGKRMIIDNASEKQEWLEKLFPSYLIDVLFYKNTYDAKRIMDDYFQRYKNNGGDLIDAVECTVCSSLESLKKLKKENYGNYCYVVLDILKDYYCYIKFLVSTNVQSDNKKKSIVFQMENDLERFFKTIIIDDDLFDDILSEYILYNLSSHKQINKYYDNEPQGQTLIKVAKECERLKKSK